jgi:hypothetical protein
MEKNPEDAALLERAYALCGGPEGFGKNFPWEASYILRVKRGEKPMADPLRWALKKIIEEKERRALPIRDEACDNGDTSWVKVKLDPEVVSELQSLAGIGRDSINAIIQSAVIKYIAEFKTKDHLTIFKPGFLKTLPATQQQSSRLNEPPAPDKKKES